MKILQNTQESQIFLSLMKIQQMSNFQIQLIQIKYQTYIFNNLILNLKMGCLNGKTPNNTSLKYQISGQQFNTNNPTPQLKNSYRSIPPTIETISIEVQILNKSINTLTVSINTTVEQLKIKIYDEVSKQLLPSLMNLYLQGNKQANNRLIKDLRPTIGIKLRIRQDKIDLAEVKGLNVDPKGVDCLTDQIGTAKMICGHSIGRDSMVQFIYSIISKKKFEIRCPYNKSNNTPCLALWEFDVCKRVGVLTKTQAQKFETELTLNILNKDTKHCPNPKCDSLIIKQNLSSNHVACPNCNTAPFCYLCLDPWKSEPNSKQCGNKQCNFYDQFIANSKLINFTLNDESGNPKVYLVPQNRACVFCKTVIQYVKDCKHMNCKVCMNSFCWICLETPQNGKFKCRGAFDFCGRLASPQKLK